MTGPRRHHALLALVASALALATALVPGASAQAGTPGAGHGGTPARSATVMTRNLYLGADLGPILAALATGNNTAIVGAATRTWGAVQATLPPERMAAIADEIIEADADVVGLQEVTTWTTYAYNPQTGAVSNPTVAYDFLDLLLDALAARGAGYYEVAGATAHNFSSPPIPVLASPSATFPTRAVQLADRDVVIARSDVTATNARTGTYQNIVSFPFGGTTLPVARGWGSADVRVGKATFRFVNSHLEAFGIPGVDAEQVRVAQVGELLAAQDAIAASSGDLPIVYVGDYNSVAPTGAAYSALLAGVGTDAWTRSHPGDPGFTCCLGATLTDPDNPLTSRIDLVLLGEGVKAPRATIVGDDPSEMTASGLWPTDHAGVVARLVVPARRCR
ncbi:endonuclease/exonuclease/phosphatase family protein [Nocardioides sp.]|uniref:endonuclease/exonuclease/phosphatase family protein n=1 Tax=Nocardioides sp. TaxID=35761 RepID=UPI0035B23440